MTTLVVASSKHGSTREIAERIAKVLRENKGVTTVVEDTKDAPKWLATVEAVVVALPIYAGSLDKAGKAFLDTYRAELAGVSLFIAVSGGAPELDGGLRATVDAYGARDVTYLRGALFEEKLSFKEKLLIKLAKGQYGDYRDWDAVDSWGKSLANRGAN
ncbi:flavodoxin domain-containing protein [Citricoccus sp. GCM10030269]|uniref:flavodoxin domain-containing protein n=1 Tax=Citricoccus sp. GCM10030269 TaxID=3273388 RepID=UPI00361AA8CF